MSITKLTLTYLTQLKLVYTSKIMIMFNKRQTELDEIYERVLVVMEKSSNNEAKRIERLETLYTVALERMTRLEEASLEASKRMDRIEAMLESNITSIEDLNTAAFNVFNVINLMKQNFEVIQQNFEVMVTEVKGVQTENRNLFDHLFGIQE